MTSPTFEAETTPRVRAVLDKVCESEKDHEIGLSTDIAWKSLEVGTRRESSIDAYTMWRCCSSQSARFLMGMGSLRSLRMVPRLSQTLQMNRSLQGGRVSGHSSSLDRDEVLPDIGGDDCRV